MQNNWESDSEEEEASSDGQGAMQPSFLEQFQELKFQAIKREALKQAKTLYTNPTNGPLRCPICTLPLEGGCRRASEHVELFQQREEEMEEQKRQGALEDQQQDPGRRSPNTLAVRRRSSLRSPRPGSPGRRAGSPGSPRAKKAQQGARAETEGEFAHGGREQQQQLPRGVPKTAEELERATKLAEYHEQKEKARQEAEEQKREAERKKLALLKEREEKRQARGTMLKHELTRLNAEKERKEEEAASKQLEQRKEAKAKEALRRRKQNMQRQEVEDWRAKKEQNGATPPAVANTGATGEDRRSSRAARQSVSGEDLGHTYGV